MAPSPSSGSSHEDNRRDFLRGSSLLLAGVLPAAKVRTPQEVGSAVPASRTTAPRVLKIGLIGCGRRGLAVTRELLAAANDQLTVHLTAAADLFPDRLQQTLRSLKGQFSQTASVHANRRFVGPAGYQALLESDVDVVLLTTPPALRPQHFEAAVAAAKHIYAERPIAVDAAGVGRFETANASAVQQHLAVSVGLPRRCDPRFQATLAQLQQGAIGSLHSAEAYHWLGATQLSPRPKHTSEVEYQLRNWRNHNPLSGGPWVESHLQNLDVINWLLDTHPIAASPLLLHDSPSRGFVSPSHDSPSRDQAHLPTPPTLLASSCAAQFVSPTSPGDNHSSIVEFHYPTGLRMLSGCYTAPTTQSARSKLTVHGSSGHCDILAGKIFDRSGRLTWQASDELPPTRRDSAQLSSLLSAIASGESLNQGALAADSTLTAILGRMVATHGRPVAWHDCQSSVG